MVLGALRCLKRSPRGWQPAAHRFSGRWVTSVTTDEPSFPYKASEVSTTSVVHSRGIELLQNPVYNKGTAYSLAERERLGLRGLLPPQVLPVSRQMSRTMDRYWHGSDFISPEEIEAGGISHEHTRKWQLLTDLQDRNETLFYRCLIENFVEMAPILYTPTVGWACINYHKLYRRPRGMYFSAVDRGKMETMVHNWPHEEVDAIVVTDGSRILGLGDLGCNGLGIPIGKLDLYVAAGGFNPSRVLPCVIDVGTNNELLRGDPWYMGLKQPRLRGDAYYSLVDEFVRAVMSRWPDAVLQFEDFAMEHAAPLLERYRHKHTVFNDDIQGTACVALSGLYGAMRVLGSKSASDLTKMKVVVVGAGSAGMGVVSMIARGMENHGLTAKEAAANFWVLDRDGLITTRREELPPHVARFARADGESREGERLVDTIRRVKPGALIGLAGAGRIFTHEVLKAMAEVSSRPIIFPMSNPIAKMECTHAEALRYTDGRAVFASGSPQGPVVWDGQSRVASQANNMYIFPGVALGAYLARAGIVTDTMLMAASEALAHCTSPEELELGMVYPSMNRIRDISLDVAVAVINAAGGLVQNERLIKARAQGDGALREFVQAHMYHPEYTTVVYK